MATGATVAAGHSALSWPAEDQYPQAARTAVGALVQSSSSTALHALPERDSGGTTRQATDRAERVDETAVADVESLTKAVEVGEKLAKNALRIQEALADGAPAASIFDGVEFVKPCTGRFTSGFGARWGTKHYGIDIANRIGTPIYAVTDGVVVAAGPASGFGLWVKVRHPSGYTSVYGHINRALVREGQKVKAGQKIAEMGNRGHSTGPHLHLEIWDANDKKINPLSWLAARGIRMTDYGSSRA